jgi:hypothetical protein
MELLGAVYRPKIHKNHETGRAEVCIGPLPHGIVRNTQLGRWFCIVSFATGNEFHRFSTELRSAGGAVAAQNDKRAAEIFAHRIEFLQK